MMKKLIAISIIFISIKAVAQPVQKVLADKVIAIVGDRAILKSDVENSIIDMKRQGIEIPNNAKCMVFEQALSVKALILQAEKDSIPVTDDEVQTEIDQKIEGFIRNLGSVEELERQAGKTVFQLRQDFRSGIKDRKLAQAMRSKIVEDVKITPTEVKNYFEKIPKDSLPTYESELEIGEIIMRPKPNRDAEEYVKEQLKDFKEQLENKKKDFCYIAKIYSEDPGSKDNCGAYEVNRTAGQMDGTWIGKAFSLKEGQISQPFKTQFGYHIVQLTNRRGDDATIKHILRIPQVGEKDVKEVYAKLDTVLNQIKEGKITFGEAVSKYSEDEAHKFTAGMKLNRDGGPLTIDQLDKELVLLLKTLKVGDYSTPQNFEDERNRRGLRIIYLKKKTDAHKENLLEDYDKIAQRALEEKKSITLENWFLKRIPNFHIVIDKDFANCEGMEIWSKNAKIK